MSSADRKSNDNLPEAYKVGYKKPPREHQFRKGQSGNPAGRPKGAKNKPKIDHGYGMRAAEEYLRTEAYRMVTIREGDDLIEMPAIQAVFRAMGVSAMKGNRFAQRNLADLITNLEQRDADTKLECLSAALDYKQKWAAEIARCKRHELPIPEPVPHPDDMILDVVRGEVRIEGPKTEEQKAHYKKAIERRAEAQDEVNYFAEQYAEADDEETKASWLEEWHFEQRIFDIINDSLAPRYQMKLENRSYAVGASREGEALRELVEDRARPPHLRRWGEYVEGG